MLKKFAVPMVAVIGAAGMCVPQAIADEAVAAKECSVQVVSGSVKWGIKHSWRNYIQGNIAKGQWETTGKATEGTGDKKNKDFQFNFEVDPARTKIAVENGKITTSEIRTKDSSITFTGHHGALYSQVKSPIIKTSGDTVSAGSGYLGYYVPGKNMTQYTEKDRVDANKKQGEGIFSKGKVETASLSGETLTLKGSNLRYTPQPGTKDGKIEGVDVLFMGIYNENYLPEVDDVDVELKVKNNCGNISGTGNPAADLGTPGSLSKPWAIVLGILGGFAALAGLFHVFMNSGLLQNLPFFNR
ncbi:HtaA domain-containing protein [Corynebacterium pseudotuberculosis]|uniref:HtaA domain-containing protein n=1 Tax=Corynebacterium pseudotuberculosis TaxID=1719 RepID=UPI0002504566|nr:HtaA domain-containing protein [Corynebacterium pseudotuberculosis]AFB72810.1 hypothetical protein CP316_07505 [Corynebacterium pseudotuberculosis 316]ASC75784.1 hypothetical protein BFG01_007360 [Corynebacterium pseudotuberculosis]AUY60910.1 Membrane protein [Corynebacterium pseudotuberculosis]WAE78305.1 HtaA domain-containing protein [Corynebacterium pseudotuberculosis]WAE80355.1 HtaA domain-containing protein [Corynebacterium pseudotuberculosis]